MRNGIIFYAVLYLLANLFVQQLALLPSWFLILSLAAVSLAGILCLKFYIRYTGINQENTLIITYICLIIISIISVKFSAELKLARQLDERLAGQDILVTGVVSNLPVDFVNSQRFELAIDSFQPLNNHMLQLRYPKKIRLGWYHGKPVKYGEQWQLRVRLKPPHGFMNPGGFDYEQWLFQNGIQATGYVRKSGQNQLLKTAPGFSIVSARSAIKKQLDKLQHDNQTMSLVKALAIGYKSDISDHQWEILRFTGTSHLMAISGLHIGLAALFGVVIVRRMLRVRMVPARVLMIMPAQHLAMMAGLLPALFYSILAGLSVPTQRAMIMLLVLAGMMLSRHHHRPLDSLGAALILVLLFDPFATLSAGFWFSFTAVAVIFLSYQKATGPEGMTVSFREKLKRVLWLWIRLQFLIGLFLLPLSLFMFGEVSIVSPVVNLLLIPYVSFLVVPLILVAILISLVSTGVSDFLYLLASDLLSLAWVPMQLITELPYVRWQQGAFGMVELLLTSSALVIVYMAPRIRQICREKGLLLPVMLPYVLSVFLVVPVILDSSRALRHGDISLAVLDVGQGSATIIQTTSRVLLFDTGAHFSDRLDAGKSVIIPYLRSRGIENIDTIIISHADNDHIGGLSSILEEYPQTRVIGQPDMQQGGIEQFCSDAIQWVWDGVSFQFLSPAEDELPKSRQGRNNLSCVLKVSSDAGSILLTGDIEKQKEAELVSRYADELASNVLIVPHHGSKTSSHQAFIDRVNPDLAIISAGYRNRYHHPNEAVVSRIEAEGRKLFNTTHSGALNISIRAGQPIEISEYRLQHGKYWHHRL